MIVGQRVRLSTNGPGSTIVYLKLGKAEVKAEGTGLGLSSDHPLVAAICSSTVYFPLLVFKDLSLLELFFPGGEKADGRLSLFGFGPCQWAWPSPCRPPPAHIYKNV